MSDAQALLAIAGLALITLLTRGFFVLPERDWPLPDWLRDGLRHAPIAALVAVVAPDLLLTRGAWVGSWHDARLVGAAVAVAWMLWRRDMLSTIVVGTAVMLTCRLGFGW